MLPSTLSQASPHPRTNANARLQTCAISVIRIQYLSLSNDVTWDNVASSCWSIGELCSGITCACLPTLRPLVSKCLPSMRSQSGKSSGKYYQKSSERDGSAASHPKAGDTNSSRGIIYPQDLELQSDDRSDKEFPVTRIEQAGPNASHQKPSRAVDDKLSLGLNPTVRTEVKVGSPGAQPSWTAMDRRIEVKTDFVMTKELP